MKNFAFTPQSLTRADLLSTPYGRVKPGLGISPNSGPPVGGIAPMAQKGFFGDNTNDLLPSTVFGKNGSWFFGKRKRGTAKLPPRRGTAKLPPRRGRSFRFGARMYGVNDSLSGVGPTGPPNMRTFPMLGAYPGEVGSGDLIGGMANNGAFVGPENALMSYYFTYGRAAKAAPFWRKSRSGRKSRKIKRLSKRRSTRRSTSACWRGFTSATPMCWRPPRPCGGS